MKRLDRLDRWPAILVVYALALSGGVVLWAWLLDSLFGVR